MPKQRTDHKGRFFYWYNEAMTKVVITSHGFDVRRDSNGFFPDLAAAISDARFILFDYNELLPNGDSIVPSLYDQAKLLEMAVEQTDSDDITILAHSQGSVVASLARLSDKVKQVILLAPPINLSSDYLAKKFQSRPGAEANFEGISKLPRSDGTNTFFTKGYVESVDAVNPSSLYQNLANYKPTLIVRATKDEILGLTDSNKIKNVKHFDIETDHNFTTNGAREQLVSIIKKEL